jgi:beta-glucanase (GH16 family)
VRSLLALLASIAVANAANLTANQVTVSGTLRVTSTASLETDIDLTGYTQVFSDEFSSLSVGTHHGKGSANWGDWPPYGPAGAFSVSHWSEVGESNYSDIVNVSGGLLNIFAKWNTGTSEWNSAVIVSNDVNADGFAQTFGYWSARIKVANAGQGAWSAFWLGSQSGIPSGGTKGYEVDIMEAYGGGPGTYDTVVHPWNADGSQGTPEGGQTNIVPGGDLINTWHIYGCRVDTQNITFYLDGVQVFQIGTNIDYLQDPLYILCNYALQNPLSGAPFTTLGDSFMQVDWIRAYRLPGPAPVFVDTFNRGDGDSLGRQWDEHSGDVDIVNSNLTLMTTLTDDVAIYSRPMPTINQFFKGVIGSTFAAGTFGCGPLFRYTNGTSPHFFVKFNPAADTVSFYHKTANGGTFTVMSTAALTINNGEAFGVTINGTGASTIVRVWKNPTSDVPDSATSWGGDSSPDVTLDMGGHGSGFFVDSGLFAGIGGTPSALGGLDWDNVFEGTL